MKLATHCYLMATEEEQKNAPYTLTRLHGVVFNQAYLYFRNVNNIRLSDTGSHIKVATNNLTWITVTAEF
jgi:hypothetical protein